MELEPSAGSSGASKRQSGESSSASHGDTDSAKPDGTLFVPVRDVAKKSKGKAEPTASALEIIKSVVDNYQQFPSPFYPTHANQAHVPGFHHHMQESTMQGSSASQELMSHTSAEASTYQQL